VEQLPLPPPPTPQKIALALFRKCHKMAWPFKSGELLLHLFILVTALTAEKLHEFIVNEIRLGHMRSMAGSFVVAAARLLHTSVVDYVSIETPAGL